MTASTNVPATTPRRAASRIRGFTLIELVVVLVLLGILGATMLPRFMDSQVEAHEAAVKATGNAFATAVTMVHAQWQANGAVPSQDDIAGFGDGSVDVSATGWPTDTDGANTIIIGETGRNRCARLFRSLLLNGPQVTWAPPPGETGLISAAHAGGGAPRDPAADYWASAPGFNACSFTYRPLANMSIGYDCVTGQVVVDADASS